MFDMSTMTDDDLEQWDFPARPHSCTPNSTAWLWALRLCEKIAGAIELEKSKRFRWRRRHMAHLQIQRHWRVAISNPERALCRKLLARECFDSDDDECPPPPRLALPDSDEPQLQFALSDDEGPPPLIA